MSSGFHTILETFPKKTTLYNNFFSLFQSPEDINDPIKRIQKLSKSRLEFHRIRQTKNLLEVGYEIGYNKFILDLLPVVTSLASDNSASVREAICNQIGDFTGFFIQEDPDKGIQLSINFLLPIIEKLLNDKNDDVQKSACHAFVAFSTHLRPEGVTEIISLALQIANGSKILSSKNVASLLLNGLSESVGPEICLSFFVPQIQCLAEDIQACIRQSVAENITSLCETIGPSETASKILPIFKTLCTDLHFNVRAATVISLPEVLMLSTMEPRLEFISMMRKLLADSYPKVQFYSIHALGRFLVSLNDPKHVNSDLLETFTAYSSSAEHYNDLKFETCETIDQSLPDDYKKKDGALDFLFTSFAYSLFDIWEILGSQGWSHLNQSLSFLLKYPNSNIREKISSNLHRIAILFENDKIYFTTVQNAQKDYLFEVFKTLILDSEPPVKTSLIDHLHLSISYFDKNEKVEIFQLLEDTLKTSDLQWRIRLAVAEQLKNLWKLPLDACKSVLLKLTFNLCTDEVYEVRRKALETIPPLLNKCCHHLIIYQNFDSSDSGKLLNNLPDLDHSSESDIIHLLIQKFCRSRSFIERQSFVYLCDEIVSNISREFFNYYFTLPLASLCLDPVSSVRIAWARTFSRHIRSNGRLSKNSILLYSARKLKNEDPTPDVLGPLNNLHFEDYYYIDFNFTTYGQFDNALELIIPSLNYSNEDAFNLKKQYT